MNKDIKEKWLEALRSGDFKQGKNLLRCGDEFCCMGVLAHINDQLWFDAISRTYSTLNKQHLYIDLEFANLCEIDHETENTLSTMNDKGNKTFIEIADWIEQNL